MARPLDRNVDEAIVEATVVLLAEQGFAAMTMEAVAKRAGVGKPAIYRRFPDKPSLVTAVISRQLPALEVPDLGDTRAELWTALEKGLPADGPSYVRLIGGLIAEERRHPELIEAFRQHVLRPRRAIVQGLIERGVERGDIRAEVEAVTALDSLAGPFLARVFAGLDTGPEWRRAAFDTWWEAIARA
jgi:AcrR family transcriptional regulator